MSLERYSRGAVAARLKQARAAKFGTASEAARTLGMKEVTVRAHENGQNRLSERNAQKYARLYGVTPQWLLFGDDAGGGLRAIIQREQAEIAAVRPTRTPVWQDARSGAFATIPDYSDLTQATSFVPASVDGYGFNKVFAVRVADDHALPDYPPNTFLLMAATSELDIRMGDHVVILHPHPADPSLIETIVSRIEEHDEVLAYYPIAPEGEMGASREPIFKARTLGVVLGTYFRRDRSGPALLSNADVRAALKNVRGDTVVINPDDTE